MRHGGAYLTDGTKAVPLSALRPEAWTPMDEDDAIGGHGLSARTGRVRVPVLFRAVDIRAKAVASMPFRLERNGVDVTDDAALAQTIKHLRTLLYLTEASLCCYNAAYWEIATNRLGRNVTPFWLATPTIQPDIDPRAGVRGIRRVGPTGQVYLPVEQVCVFWGPSTDIEIGPDPQLAPVAVTLAAAGLLHYLDRFATGFFQRGGTKVTLLTVEGNPRPGEVEKLDAWWKRMAAGVKNAFNSVVVRAGVKPEVIGSSIDETSAPDLAKIAREDVALGMGVPLSLLFSNALAGGTVDAERLNFYDFTVVPECEHVLDEPLNEQYLARLGLRLIWTPERLEVYQAAELQKASALMQLVGQPLMTVDESRERLELPPLAQVAPPAPTPEPDPASTTPPTPDTPPAMDDSVEQPTSDVAALRTADLERWQRKALKRLARRGSAACTFESNWIDDDDREWIEDVLAHATTPDAVKAAFKVAPPGDDLTDMERPLYERLRGVFDRASERVVQSILRGQSVALDDMTDGMRAALTTAITSIVDAQIETLVDEFGIAFDDPTIAQDIAQRYRATTLTDVERTTRRVVERAVETYRATPGMTKDDLVRVLRSGFGARRAELIAITTATDAAAQAIGSYQRTLRDAGIMTERVWHTASDERVCPVCTPRNGRVEGDGWDTPPPAHGRCRCFLTLRVVRRERDDG